MSGKHPLRASNPKEFEKGCHYIGKMLREYRECNGLTQKEIAEKFDFGANFLSLIEHGKTPIPPERIRELCEAYGMGDNAEGFALFIYRYLYPNILEASRQIHQIRQKFRKADDEIVQEAIKSFGEKCKVTSIEELR